MLKEREAIILVSNFLDEDEIIDNILFDETNYYIETARKNRNFLYDDDRNKTVGGRGPIKVNKETGDIERIHYLDFPSGLKKEKEIPTNDEIENKIRSRRYINEEDIFYFAKNEFGEKASKYFTVFQLDEQIIGIDFFSFEAKKAFCLFFDKSGIELASDQYLKVLIRREIK